MFSRLLVAPAAAFALIAFGAEGLSGCARTGPGDSDVGNEGGHDAGPPPVVDAGPPVQTSDKLDVLFVVDNSDDLDFAHEVLAGTVPYLMARLSQPACVNGLGNIVATTASPTDPCPDGVREFAPVTDVHIGVVSTSLGGHGADTCSPASANWNPTQNDGAHLLTRGPGGTIVPSYDNKGFLAWDPLGKDAPPGDADLPTFDSNLAQMIVGSGDQGCGYESQLESFYRFLVEPNPSTSVVLQGGIAVPVGTDSALLQQRADFLRPDSAVAIVLLSDEDDCSTIEGGSAYLSDESLTSTQQEFHMPRARAICATNPADPCCGSCGAPAPAGCGPNEEDPGCLAPPYTDTDDPLNLRCFDQKRRFGIDFRYPVDRYITGLGGARVADRDGNVVENPLFVGGRAPELVVFAAIVGVPWQDIAPYPTSLALGFAQGSQINWPMVIGDPANYVDPTDPLMVPSVAPRTGNNPAIGAALEPPDAGYLANPINGHERDIATLDDLQDTCIYKRVMPKDCSSSTVINDCDCTTPAFPTNPICQAPDGSYSTLELGSRAQPGIRELRVVEGLGDQGVAASICAPETVDTKSAIYGYKPAVDAVLRALRKRLL